MRKLAILLLFAIISTITFAIFATPKIRTLAPDSNGRMVVVNTPSELYTPKVDELVTIRGWFYEGIVNDLANEGAFYPEFRLYDKDTRSLGNNPYVNLLINKSMHSVAGYVEVTGYWLNKKDFVVESMKELAMPTLGTTQTTSQLDSN
jgi:hypothetical protein